VINLANLGQSEFDDLLVDKTLKDSIVAKKVVGINTEIGQDMKAGNGKSRCGIVRKRTR